MKTSRFSMKKNGNICEGFDCGDRITMKTETYY
jgi:hypothetical protein